MDDQNESGAKDNAISKQSPEPNPIAITPKSQETTIFSKVVISIRQNPVKAVCISLALMVAIVTIIAGIFEIPNSVMGWFINARTLFHKNGISLKDRLVLTVRTKSQFNLIVLTNHCLLFDVTDRPAVRIPNGMLFLPFPEKTPEVELRFGLKNPSERLVELASIGVAIPSWVVAQASPEWKTTTEGDFRGFSFRLDEPMLKNEPCNVYPIKFLTFGTNVSHPFPMTVTIYDKNCPPYGVLFMVSIVPAGAVTNPNPSLIIRGN